MDFNEKASVRIENAFSRVGILATQYTLSEIPGDLSPRRYARVDSLDNNFISKFGANSIVAMVFDSIKPPEAEAKIIRTSDSAFIELAEFFDHSGLPVPKIYLDARDIGVVLLEDLGTQTLIELVKSNSKNLKTFYFEAVSLIHQIQAIPVRKDFFAYERSFDQAILEREMNQFLEFVMTESITEFEKNFILKVFNEIANTFMNFKQVLVHRDFHSWNLMVDKTDKLRVIDFQDALMGPRCYDLVALLHERDIDLLLEPKLVLELENQFFSYYNESFLREFEFPIVQLQRDLKVSGLFVKVKKLRGLGNYEKWVPGTLKRIGSTLEVLSDQNKLFLEFKNILLNKGIKI
jgi:aminoglycoside/choline kinase family phosphotransferase